MDIIQEVKQLGRVIRKPTHNFAVRFQPWQITPMFIAPVVPGETMSNLLYQASCLTPRLKSVLTGWWFETYFFYVKHRDLADRDTMTAMHVLPDFDPVTAGLGSSVDGDPFHYYSGDGPDYVRKCLHRVTETYFRSPDEGVADGLIGGRLAASVNTSNWMDSLRPGDRVDYAPGEALLDQRWNDLDVPAGFEDHFAQWQQMTATGLVTATFDDYLRSFGIKVPKAEREEQHIPELVRYAKHWKMPTAITDGSNAGRGCFWEVSERADKDRLFKEPGFLFGVVVARPKVYLGGQAGSITSLMTKAHNWLPAVMSSDPYTSLMELNDGQRTLPGLDLPDEGAWFDVKDLFLYGEQFVNFDLSSTNAGIVALPAAGMQRRYASDADVAGLYMPGGEYVSSEGTISLNIKTRIADTSGRSGGGYTGSGR